MKVLLMVLMVLALAVSAQAAVLHEGCVKEEAGPRAGHCRTFGWQDRERLTASSYDQSQFQSDSDSGQAGADAAAAAAAAEAAAEAAAADAEK